MSNFVDVLKHIEENEIIFRTNLLSNKNLEVVFRPMKVKDQKALLVNSESESIYNQIKAYLMLLNSSVKESQVKVDDLCIQDFIWLLVNLRMRSVGEIIELVGTCQECKEKVPNLKIDLTKDLELKYLEGLKNNTIDVTKDLKLFLNFPKIKCLTKPKTGNITIDLLLNELDYVEYKGEIIELKEDDKLKLLEGLDSKYLKEFESFEKNNEFGISINLNFVCPHCQKVNNTKIEENILSFF